MQKNNRVTDDKKMPIAHKKMSKFRSNLHYKRKFSQYHFHPVNMQLDVPACSARVYLINLKLARVPGDEHCLTSLVDA